MHPSSIRKLAIFCFVLIFSHLEARTWPPHILKEEDLRDPFWTNLEIPKTKALKEYHRIDEKVGSFLEGDFWLEDKTPIHRGEKSLTQKIKEIPIKWDEKKASLRIEN